MQCVVPKNGLQSQSLAIKKSEIPIDTKSMFGGSNTVFKLYAQAKMT